MTKSGCTCKNVDIGSYDNQVIVDIPKHMSSYKEARVREGLSPSICLDKCIVNEINFLWSHDIKTFGSCCGHGVKEPMVNVSKEDMDKMHKLGFKLYPVEVEFDGLCKETFILKISDEQKFKIVLDRGLVLITNTSNKRTEVCNGST